ncbi:ABC transporter ATP-binding protein [Cylindrospermopsis raciborskii]|uniref:ABC transporter ATP-binding protein n=1 Tax=Cylindrospermopsis raciborskii TaxID=77022 RepID=UPI000778DEAB|nr:ABC transporter ATP-binding protein [Cylindrospermopsis raciborskii]MCZ2202634.1 ABC transporter ATP-binding protein [Cylindrospermopsis raciborskii PAMP2012]MCZ2204866.1 ABC transporter ATP-binding protein [Cylindrospermopsis raciborskii PAMP2011]
MAKVVLNNVKRKFDKVTAIENISFEVPDGEFWVLVGPSGCGKSTILRTIAGLETITSGTLYIGDRLVNDIPARSRDVAMVFQNYALYPHKTVAENIAFGLEMRQVDRKTIQSRVMSVAGALSLEHLLDRKPKQLSGGQQQRVALGRAIARQPQVFLLDEPLSNLDTQLRDDTRTELKQLHQKLNITTIYVTHDQVEAMTLADKIVVLNRGKIQQIGDPQSIYSLPANRMVATFLGNPPMNIIPATVKEDMFDVGRQLLAIPNQIAAVSAVYPGQNYHLGIRPEHIRIVCQGDDSQNISREPGELGVEVKVVEPLGKEILVRVELPSCPGLINMQVERDRHLHPGEKLKICLDLNNLFVFETSDGVRIFPL